LIVNSEIRGMEQHTDNQEMTLQTTIFVTYYVIV